MAQSTLIGTPRGHAGVPEISKVHSEGIAGGLFAKPALHVVAWPTISVGSLVAAGTMGGYFWRHHSNLAIKP